MSNDEIWEKFLTQIREKLSSISYCMWFENSKLLSLNEDKAIIYILCVENVNKEQFIKNLIEHYYDVTKNILYDITNNDYDIEFTCEKDYIFEDTNINKNLTNDIISNVDTDYYEGLDEFMNYKYYNKFNPKHTFDTFVVGDSNRIAYWNACAVAKNPGKLYNPYFIYGKSGLGKTHLMHAIGNYIVQNSDLKVLYITTEQFKNDYSLMSQYKNKSGSNITYLEAFRKKYRNVDVLMIDDIQFLSTAAKTQIEFTNTFNSLYDNDKQIIIASDTSVKDLDSLADRLKTRFLSGLTDAIAPPDIELKKQIIRSKIKVNDYDINLSEDVIDYIACYCGTDVRTLEGAVTRLVAYNAMFKCNIINLELAKEALVQFTDNVNLYRTTTIPKIIDIVAKYYNVEPSVLKGKMRKKEIVQARSIAMYLSRIETDQTVERIGLEFGGKDHSTVVHWTNKISEEMKTNSSLANDIKILKEKICE